MDLEPLLRFASIEPDSDAVVDASGAYSYAVLAARVISWSQLLEREAVVPHAIVSLESDYSLECVAALLALIQGRATVVPLSRDSAPHRDEFLDVAQVERRLHPDEGRIEPTDRHHTHPLYQELETRDAPGLVLFTSGSTGRSKGAVHDFARLCQKFVARKRRFRTIVFLQPDHIGGINTLLYTLSNGGAVVLPTSRQPEHVCELIRQHRVELLPTSPTFLRLLLHVYDPSRHDLSSLKLITYGTEPMPESTLRAVRELLPHVQMQQTYGLTEVGILRSQSREDGSLWVRVGGEGFDVQVREGRLWVKADSAMLGYLNAPSPFSPDGYLDTGDAVEVDGEWLRILGRRSDTINVGGNKAHPVEIEDVILQMPEVDDVVVYGEANALMGQAVAARVRLREPMPAPEFRARLRGFCAERLPAFKIPSRVIVTEDILYGARYKRQRGGLGASEA